MKNWIICSDFDGTISLPDSSDFLLSCFASSDWKKLEELTWTGKMPERESYQAQIALLYVSWPQAREALLNGVKIRPGFKEFVEWARAQEIPFEILSSGLKPLIVELLNHAGIPDVKVESHELQITDKQWKVVLHPGARLAEHCSHCKCAHLVKHHAAGLRVVYIGDSYTDLCPSKYADILFATHKLAEVCGKDCVPFYPFSTFYDVRQTLDALLHSSIQESSL